MPVPRFYDYLPKAVYDLKDEVSLTSGHDYKSSTVTASSGKKRYSFFTLVYFNHLCTTTMYGRVIKLLGSDQVLVKCTDDITRRGRIRGKLKRRIWIRDNDVVVIAPWDFKETERGDIVWRFTLPQVDWLKDNDHIPKDF